MLHPCINCGACLYHVCASTGLAPLDIASAPLSGGCIQTGTLCTGGISHHCMCTTRHMQHSSFLRWCFPCALHGSNATQMVHAYTGSDTCLHRLEHLPNCSSIQQERLHLCVNMCLLGLWYLSMAASTDLFTLWHTCESDM